MFGQSIGVAVATGVAVAVAVAVAVGVAVGIGVGDTVPPVQPRIWKIWSGAAGSIPQVAPLLP